MKKFVSLCSLLIAGSFAHAATEIEVLRGMCTGLTTSGKTVVMTFCAPSSGGTKLVSCTPRGRGAVNVSVDVTYPDQSNDSTTMRAKYSTIISNNDDGFEAQAYNVTRRQLRSGMDHNWVSVNAVAGEPSHFAMDLGPGFWFEFHNAECHFDSLDNQDQQ